RAFVQDRAGWLRAQLASVVPEQRPAFGQALPYRGESLILAPGTGRGVLQDGERLLAPPDADRLGPRLAGFFKTRARDALVAACDRHAAALGRDYGRITLRDTRSRWGSCSPRGDLMFSWRLIMAPDAVLDYVAAHEVAHLAHMDHSPAFWAVVDRLFPGHAGPRRWLRDEGASLHRIRFE
ncbi:M48 family metallopeptidase, partial [Roseovarius sp. SYSU LYC5161]|uniref:M48 family metallopeptidase n=1 Tax=Roseovarius halophilus (ex Wu et al. 2025) TaxID=3376060 RepID=UPI00399A4F41